MWSTVGENYMEHLGARAVEVRQENLSPQPGAAIFRIFLVRAQNSLHTKNLHLEIDSALHLATLRAPSTAPRGKKHFATYLPIDTLLSSINPASRSDKSGTFLSQES